MRVLTMAAEVNAELIRLLRACSSCQVAVAWASVGFRAFDLLAKYAKKIKQMVVGTHFYQTHPDFIERFLTHSNVRFVLNPDGVFHPKVYLSLALDLIPAAGSISREMYLNYIEQYKKAFPKGRHGIATATRLLAMKRPDTFVCFDKLNRESLCKDFGISQNVGYEEYWDSIIERIVKEASWWSAPAPPPGVERDVWEARAAFLDSIYYDRSDLAAS